MRFLPIFVAATVMVHIPFVMVLGELASWLAWSWVSLPMRLALAAAFSTLAIGRARLLRWERPISWWRYWLLEQPYYTHWFGLVVSLAVLPRMYWAGAKMPFSVAYGLGLLLAGWSVYVQPRWLRIEQLEVAIENLPPQFDGYCIAQLSDLHIGALCTTRRARGWVRRVNDANVDLVALTGDYVTSGVKFHQQIAEVLAELQATDGVVAVMGNHDYFGEGQPLMDLLSNAGIRLLRNEALMLTRDGGAITVAGVDDVYTKRIDVEATVAAWQKLPSPALVLAHDPSNFVELAEAGAALVLSGHTHWGQIAIPGFAKRLNWLTPKIKHHAGLYKHGCSQLYVSPGLGTSGPPLRVGTRPEITMLRLRSAIR